VDGRAAEDAAQGDEQRELDAASDAERRDLDPEEVLPELGVALLDRNQLLEGDAEIGLREPEQGAVERQIEQLVEDDALREPARDAGPPPPRRGHEPDAWLIRSRCRSSRERRRLRKRLGAAVALPFR
jgi:hypothetical protein